MEYRYSLLSQWIFLISTTFFIPSWLPKLTSPRPSSERSFTPLSPLNYPSRLLSGLIPFSSVFPWHIQHSPLSWLSHLFVSPHRSTYWRSTTPVSSSLNCRNNQITRSSVGAGQSVWMKESSLQTLRSLRSSDSNSLVIQIRTWAPLKWSNFPPFMTKKKRIKSNSLIPDQCSVFLLRYIFAHAVPCLTLVFCHHLSELWLSVSLIQHFSTQNQVLRVSLRAWGRILCDLPSYTLWKEPCSFLLENLSQCAVILSKVKLFYEGFSH